MRLAQRKQATMHGYFGGYIGKRQPAGHLERKKSVGKMYRLRERIQDRTVNQQYRAVSGRLITDIEMSGTLRGAVEVFNLASNLRHGDVLFAECIRTFPSRTVNAAEWFHRLEVEAQHSADKTYPR